MAPNVFRTATLCSLLLIARADGNRGFVGVENGEGWNAPPELVPEQVVKESKSERARSLSIPITANINLNTWNNAQSVGFLVAPENLSYSESSSSSRPSYETNGESFSFTAASAGLADSSSQSVIQHGSSAANNAGHVNSQSFGFGSAATSSYGTVQNGHAASGAASSASTGYSVASSASLNVGFSSGGAPNVRYPGQRPRQPIWTNIQPNHNNDYRPSYVPTLRIDARPHGTVNRGPIRLDVSSRDATWEERKPKIHIRKWQPVRTSFEVYEQ